MGHVVAVHGLVVEVVTVDPEEEWAGVALARGGHGELFGVPRLGPGEEVIGLVHATTQKSMQRHLMQNKFMEKTTNEATLCYKVLC